MMTFYNVLLSVLFLGTFSIGLGALSSSAYSQMIHAAIILGLVINNVIYAHKEAAEDDRIYRTTMNFIDLLKIVTLCLLMVIISGDGFSIFPADLARIRAVFQLEVWFWLFVFIYWLLDNAWGLISFVLTSKYAEPAELEYSRWINLSLFLAAFMVFLFSINPDVLMVLRVTVLAWLFIYVFIIKFITFIKPDAKEPTTEEVR